MKRRLRRSIAGVAIPLGIAVAGFLLFAEGYLRGENRKPELAVEAVVVLAGPAEEDRLRVLAGIEMMRRSPGTFIILPLRHRRFTWAWAVSNYDLDDSIRANQVIVGHVSKTELPLLRRYGGTYMEAFKTAQIMQRRQLNSAVIVTSAYHMRRAQLAFERFKTSQNLTFFYHGVNHRRERRAPWWLDGPYFLKILNEYQKLIIAHALYQPPPDPLSQQNPDNRP